MLGRKRFIFLLLAALLFLAISYFAMHTTTPDAGLMAKFEQIEVGVTLDEVKVLLGRPTKFARAATPGQNRPGAVAAWEVGDTVLRVTIDGDLRVTTKTCGIKSIGRRLDDLMERLFAPKRVPTAPKNVNSAPGVNQ